MLKLNKTYYDGNDPTHLSSTLTLNSMKLRDGSGIKLRSLIHCASTIVASYILALWAEWRLALTMSVSIPLMALIAFILFGRYTKNCARSTEEYMKCGTLAEESFMSIRTVTAYNLAGTLAEKYDEFYKSVQSYWHRGRIYKAVGLCTMLAIITLQQSLGWWSSGIYYLNDLEANCFFLDPDGHRCFSPGYAMVVFLLILMCGQKFQDLSQHISAVLQASTAAKVLNEIICNVSQSDTIHWDGTISEIHR